MSELPTGTVTFLFTDLEGSTRLWEEQRDAMQSALARVGCRYPRGSGSKRVLIYQPAEAIAPMDLQR